MVASARRILLLPFPSMPSGRHFGDGGCPHRSGRDIMATIRQTEFVRIFSHAHLLCRPDRHTVIAFAPGNRRGTYQRTDPRHSIFFTPHISRTWRRVVTCRCYLMDPRPADHDRSLSVGLSGRRFIRKQRCASTKEIRSDTRFFLCYSVCARHPEHLCRTEIPYAGGHRQRRMGRKRNSRCLTATRVIFPRKMAGNNSSCGCPDAICSRHGTGHYSRILDQPAPNAQRIQSRRRVDETTRAGRHHYYAQTPDWILCRYADHGTVRIRHAGNVGRTCSESRRSVRCYRRTVYRSTGAQTAGTLRLQKGAARPSLPSRRPVTLSEGTCCRVRSVVPGRFHSDFNNKP